MVHGEPAGAPRRMGALNHAPASGRPVLHRIVTSHVPRTPAGRRVRPAALQVCSPGRVRRPCAPPPPPAAHWRRIALQMADPRPARPLLRRRQPSAAAAEGGGDHQLEPDSGLKCVRPLAAHPRSAAAQKVTNQCEEDCADDLRPICVSHVDTGCKPSW